MLLLPVNEKLVEANLDKPATNLPFPRPQKTQNRAELGKTSIPVSSTCQQISFYMLEWCQHSKTTPQHSLVCPKYSGMPIPARCCWPELDLLRSGSLFDTIPAYGKPKEGRWSAKESVRHSLVFSCQA